MIPGFIGAGTYLVCDVDGCDWRLNTDQPGGARWVFCGPTRADFEDAVRRYTLAHAEEVERTLRGHLEQHDVVDFMRTIKRLKTELAQQSGDRTQVPVTEIEIHRREDPDPDLSGSLRQFWGLP